MADVSASDERRGEPDAEELVSMLIGAVTMREAAVSRDESWYRNSNTTKAESVARALAAEASARNALLAALRASRSTPVAPLLAVQDIASDLRESLERVTTWINAHPLQRSDDSGSCPQCSVPWTIECGDCGRTHTIVAAPVPLFAAVRQPVNAVALLCVMRLQDKIQQGEPVTMWDLNELAQAIAHPAEEAPDA